MVSIENIIGIGMVCLATLGVIVLLIKPLIYFLLRNRNSINSEK